MSTTNNPPEDWAMRAADADTVKEWWVLEVHQKDDDDGFWWPMGGEKHSLAEVEEYRDVVAKAKLKESTKFRIAYYRTTRQLVAAIISKHALQAPDSAPMRGETPSTTMKLKQVAHLEPKLALIEMVGHGNTLERELNEAKQLEFKRGYFLAVANIVQTHDAQVIATDVLRAYGHVDLVGIDEYDKETLRPLIAELNRQKSLNEGGAEYGGK